MNAPTRSSSGPGRDPSRRAFLHRASGTALGAALLPAASASAATAVRARALGDDEIRVALVGCGGRGTGAAIQALSTPGRVKLVAMADAFPDRLEESLGYVAAAFGPESDEPRPGRVDVSADRRFVGFDAYEKAIDADVHVVILATPPGFRPLHFQHAVARGRHVFMEKPVAVDAPGVRAVLEAARQSQARYLKVGVGLQRHHESKYREALERVHAGAIGDPVALRVYWNGAGVWVRRREESMTEMEYQMRNWYYFNWLCGDHIVEQHIHNLDVANWVMQDHPVEAQGMGGRQVRRGPEHGEIFDHFAVEYTYRDGTKMFSQSRHIPGCWASVSEHVQGTRGTADLSGGRIRGAGGWDWRFRSDSPNPYQVEHDRLFEAIREDRPFNEAENGAVASMTAILGRMAAYSGKVLSWEEALASEQSLAPAAYDWNAEAPVRPGADGCYPIAIPGVTRVL